MRIGWFVLGIAFACTGTAAAPEPAAWFEDTFDGKLAEGWSWLKEKPETWRVRDGALELRVLPEQESVLAHPLPDPQAGPFAIEMTLTSVPQPTVQYEQIGLFWYADGKNVFKYVKERIDGELYVFPGKKPMVEATVTLRIEVSGRKFTAQFRPRGEGEWLEAFQGDVPPGETHQIAIACFHGPTETEHWIRIHDFRIVKLAQEK